MPFPIDVKPTDTFKTFRTSFNDVKNKSLDLNNNLSDLTDIEAAKNNLGVQQFVDDSIIALTIVLS